MGQKPWLISSLYEFKHMPTFHNEYQHKPDFPLNTASDRKHLNISNLSPSDSPCARRDLFDVEFSDSFFVSVKTSGLNVPALDHQSAPECVHQTCTLHPGSCGGEHSVFLFRDSDESHLGFIYTQGGSNGQCERKDSAQTHNCVYNQTKLHIQSESHAKIFFYPWNWYNWKLCHVCCHVTLQVMMMMMTTLRSLCTSWVLLQQSPPSCVFVWPSKCARWLPLTAVCVEVNDRPTVSSLNRPMQKHFHFVFLTLQEKCQSLPQLW